ncbi:RNase adapter RapZ [Oscillospiraceae bacterium CM]|nr:RNase adapter RapZ [Oscillospiraceae bacterium CM]
MEILIISGLSGGGKSRVAAVLEDMDFYCVDNMPVALMPKFAELCLATRGRYERVALVTDVRAIENLNELFVALEEMGQMGCGHRILFVEASLYTIVKRYKETRRRHPLDPDGCDLEKAVRREIEIMTPVRNEADIIIDTTDLTLGRLQRRLFSIFNKNSADKPLNVSLVSFGYKYGIPIESDLVFDVRFLPNPFYIEALRSLTGLDTPVRDYIFDFEQTQIFFDKLTDLLEFLLPAYIDEGRRNLVVCIGCTGGRHRSVALTQALCARLGEKGYPVDATHRDMDRS